MAVQAELLNYLKQQLVAKVNHAQFKLGSTWKKAAINEKKINADGTVTIGFYITGNGTVSACRLRDSSNTVLASRDESISIQTGESIYYFFTYNLYELVPE